ncbi:hypothetical protein Ngar_c09780 [Candidatus Nitrososphaera gargensis Ga9.2]|uniref:Uncharacterized protein n=1 Tax=Nitrososphaera gargensis (strain Ga9.2) TaxID=1237085 RepID=K0IDV3_NITGG|nr:hypothetical protein Ngar_c09780 [Candidatus Nitrososphaera gargensis Ga9.2]
MLEQNNISSNSMISFEQIAPRWSKRLQHFPPPLFSANNISWGLQIAFADTCVVGEAHGFSGEYVQECSECRQIGFELVSSYFTRSAERMHRNIELFTLHWNKCHYHHLLDNTKKNRRRRQQQKQKRKELVIQPEEEGKDTLPIIPITTVMTS